MQTRYKKHGDFHNQDTKPKEPRSLDNLWQGQQLAFIVSKAKKLLLLQQLLPSCLPPDIASSCKVLNLLGTVLVLEVNSSVVASRLRFMAPEVLSELQDCCHDNAATEDLLLRTIRVKVRLSTSGVVTRPYALGQQQSESEPLKNKLKLDNAECAEPINQTDPEIGANYADAISHPKLRSIWRRLLGRAQNRSR